MDKELFDGGINLQCSRGDDNDVKTPLYTNIYI